MNNFIIITFTTDSLRRNLEVRKGGSLYLPDRSYDPHRKQFHFFFSPGNRFVTPYTILWFSEDPDSFFDFLPLPGFP